MVFAAYQSTFNLCCNAKGFDVYVCNLSLLFVTHSLRRPICGMTEESCQPHCAGLVLHLLGIKAAWRIKASWMQFLGGHGSLAIFIANGSSAQVLSMPITKKPLRHVETQDNDKAFPK